jgi:hypothetical protein
VSLHGGAEGGELVTKPLTFAGATLRVNYEAATGGSVRVELQDADGNPIEGFAADDCEALTGDETNAVVSWGSDADLSNLFGEAVRVRFVIANADVYSFQFGGE